jgi:hypothetical protein
LGRWRRVLRRRGKYIEWSGIENYDVNPAVFRAPIGLVVGGDRMKFGIARGGKTPGFKGVVNHEDFDEFGSARSGEFPVR